MKLFPRILPFFILAAFIIFSAACSKKVVPLNIEKDSDAISVQSITVLPVEIVTAGKDPSHTATKQLNEGAIVLTSSIKDVLQDKEGVSYLFAGQTESLLGNFHGNRHEAALFIGKKIKVDAILIPSIQRYIDREGKTYSVSQPASVSFEYNLVHVETGKTLCSGFFDETQESLFSNLFSFKQASKRGFKWITARELTLEGVKEKFNDCQYLNQ